MKKFLIVAISIVSVVILSLKITISPCENPILYRIGTVDPKFEISDAEFEKLVNQSAEVWNTVYGKKLFEPNAQADLSVNLIYDERQRQNLLIYKTEEELATKQSTLDQQIAKYESDLSAFEARIKALNQKIDEWNEKGGAPPDIYNQLRQEQAELKQEQDRLNQIAKSLNLSSDNFNQQVKNLNNNIENFNASLDERPEEGAYFPRQNRIEVYFHITNPETVHTLAHEFGHVLNLDHNDDPKSIMYYKTNNVTKPSPKEVEELKRKCTPYTLFDRFSTLIQNTVSALKTASSATY